MTFWHYSLDCLSETLYKPLNVGLAIYNCLCNAQSEERSFYCQRAVIKECRGQTLREGGGIQSLDVPERHSLIFTTSHCVTNVELYINIKGKCAVYGRHKMGENRK